MGYRGVRGMPEGGVPRCGGARGVGRDAKVWGARMEGLPEDGVT